MKLTKIAEVETIRISDEINIDLMPDGKIYGIELMNADEQLNLERDRELVFVNEMTGKTSEMRI